MFFLAMAAGIAVGGVIVFAGVWMVNSWRAAGSLARTIMLLLLFAALGTALLCLLNAIPARFLPRFAAALPVFLTCLVLLGFYRVRRECWSHRPARWGLWLIRETAGALLMPMAVATFGASILSTVAFFTTMQKGPQQDSLLLELGIVTAACWGLVTVGGVWVRGRASSGASRQKLIQ